jgi:succinylglutamic semialdehyde dehydrogenase
MGGKNPAIVWEDANLDFAIHEVLLGAFLTAGQRCSATSRVMVHKKVFSEFLDRLHTRAKAFAIGHPLENPFMGPLVESGSVDRYLKFIGMASREGGELVMRGKALELEKQGNYVTPSICWMKDASLAAAKKSVYQQTELFAPNVALLEVEDLDHAIALSNATQYGLVASVFSQNKSIYEKCHDGLQMGLINWNKSTVGASSRLPFGGFKKSGNHFPTALTSTLYCTVPVSSLEVSEPKFAPNTPGLNWD